MPIDFEQAKKSLENRHILIVEDYEDLGKRISDLIQRFTLRTPVITGSMEAARKTVKDSNLQFALVFIDVKLPSSEEVLRMIRDLEDELRRLRKEIAQANTMEENEEKEALLQEARDERRYYQERIEQLRTQDGGIKLAAEWRGDNLTFPILFLTAVTDLEKKKKGLEAAGENSEWLIKPATNDEILDACIKLLQ
jgi:DNA-binding response OmpR family regulator